MKRLNKRMVASFALVAVLLMTLAGPSWAQSAATRFNRLIVSQSLTSVGVTTLTGAVTTGGSVVIGDDLTVTDDTVVGGDLRLTPATLISVTFATATLTPLGSYQPIGSAGSVGFGAITAATAGTVLTLVNTTNTTITITDTAALKLSGNIALGQYDSLLLVSDGTNWIQRSTSNN